MIAHNRTIPIWLAFIAALMLVSGQQAAFSQEDSNLRRLTLRTDTLGWEAVGRIDIGSTGFCTGVLLRPDIVLTAAHCLFDRETGMRGDPTEMTFKAGLRDGKSVATRKIRRAVVHANYDYNEPDPLKSIRYDVALLQLSNPIPAAFAAPFKVQPISRLGRNVSVVSYAQGRSKTLSWQKKCGVIGRQDGLIGFSCDVSFGSSGAPVFDLSGQRARIVSIISSGGRSSNGAISIGMELPVLVNDLFNALRSGIGVFPSESFSSRRLQVGAGTKRSGARFVRP